MLNIEIKINEQEATITLKTNEKEYIERHEVIDGFTTTIASPSLGEQLEKDGMNEEFIEEVYDAMNDFSIHDLLTLCYRWGN